MFIKWMQFVLMINYYKTIFQNQATQNAILFILEI